jgi:hypothetical protein
MQIPADAIPPEVLGLRDELLRRGYGVVEERYDGASFGNALLDLERDGTFVRLVRERGQWFVGISGTAGSHGFAPVIWHAFLESSMPPLEVISLDVEAKLLLSDLPRIESVISDLDEQDLAELRALQSRRAKTRRDMGLELSPATEPRQRSG